MKVAVVHDVFIGTGGAERVALAIAKALRADIYTAEVDYARTYPELKRFRVHSAPKQLSKVKPPVLRRMLSSLWFASLDLEDYDVIWASGMWAHFVAFHNTAVAWYCHSPNRALYDLRERVWKRLNVFGKTEFLLWSSIWRLLDKKVARNTAMIVVNSLNTGRRVVSAYNRIPVVVYPPVDVSKFRPAKSPEEDYFLSVQRINPEKRLEIQIEAFRRVPEERLIIVGRPENEKYWARIKPLIDKTKNVEYLGPVDDKTLAELYANAKAVIQTAVDEDFGLVPVEAMASGTPVIAVGEGGFLESVLPSTGRLIWPPYVEALAKAVRSFDRSAYDPKLLREYAVRRFGPDRFLVAIKGITRAIEEVVSDDYRAWVRRAWASVSGGV